MSGTPKKWLSVRNRTSSVGPESVAAEHATSNVALECLRLHSAPGFGLLWLMPRLEGFRLQHPETV